MIITLVLARSNSAPFLDRVLRFSSSNGSVRKESRELEERKSEILDTINRGGKSYCAQIQGREGNTDSTCNNK